MKEPVLSTYKILMNKVLDLNIDNSWVDWAIEMIENGFESDSLYMLAGITNPYNQNQFELQELTSKVLADLNLDYSNKDLVIRNYVYYLISKSIQHPNVYQKTLLELKTICTDLDLDKEYMDFYLLYFAKLDLSQYEEQWYWHGANRENIDEVIKEQFEIWKTKFELEQVN